MADRGAAFGVGRGFLHWGWAFLCVLGPNGSSPVHFRLSKIMSNDIVMIYFKSQLLFYMRLKLTAWAFPPRSLVYVWATHLIVNFTIFQSGNLITTMDVTKTVLKAYQKYSIETH